MTRPSTFYRWNVVTKTVIEHGLGASGAVHQDHLMGTPKQSRLGIELSRVAKSYGTVRAVRGIDLAVTPSETVARSRAERRVGLTSVPGVWAAGNVADPRAQVDT